MKKISLIILTILLFCLMIFILAKYVFHQEKSAEPIRIAGIPANAVWKGDFDEGFWIQLVNKSTSQNQYRFKIFNDYNGILAFDGIFKLNNKCQNLEEEDSLLREIVAFQFTEEYKLTINDSCYLKAVLPAYGGTLWEIDNVK